MKRGLALAVVLMAAALLSPGADAHFGSGKKGYRSRIIAIKPAIAGIKAKVLYGDDQIWLDNHSGETVVIRGYSGEPYLRFGPGGIYVNGNSPAVYLNLDRYARSKLPKFASATAKPNWQKLAGTEIWAWHDHRIHWMSPIPPKQILDAPRKRHHLWNWKVPATANGKRFAITGSLDYVPPKKDGFPVGLAIVLGALIAVGSIGLLALRGILKRSLET